MGGLCLIRVYLLPTLLPRLCESLFPSGHIGKKAFRHSSSTQWTPFNQSHVNSLRQEIASATDYESANHPVYKP